MPQTGVRKDWDVAVIGGALSGAAAALLLKREDPSLRVVVVEKNSAFKRRVGEATVEVSGYFLCRVLGLTQFLTQTQLCKNGLRFWFSNDQCTSLADCSEIGGKYLSTVPSFLVDRAVLDEEVLRRAIAAGVEVLRPAKVQQVTLCEGGQQRLQVQTDNALLELNARWVVDASGIKSMLARANGWWQPFGNHPTLSAWSRWRGAFDWDNADFSRQEPSMLRDYVGIRGTATNHIMGRGWWAWSIALKGGDTSIGIVLDPRRNHWPEGAEPVGEKLHKFIAQHAAGRALLQNAEFIDGDVHFRRNLAYLSKVQAGDGFVLTGDAGAFLDPFYSPGMDWVSFSTCSAVRIIRAWRDGKSVADEVQRHNRDFLTSYQRMYEALYAEKYDYLEEYDLMRLAFRLDVGFYYLFVAREVFTEGMEALCRPPYSHPNAGPVFKLMRFYSSRFAAIARKRREQGRQGRFNKGRRDLYPGFNFRVPYLLKTVLLALGRWLLLELRGGWFCGPCFCRKRTQRTQGLG